ncbi:MAG: hypothetical protein ACREBE_03170 [bacterium]
MTTAPVRLFLAVVAVCALCGCAATYVRERVFDKPTARVELRHEEKGGEIVTHDYAHPATISDVRIAHILASLSYEDSEARRRPMIQAEFIYDLADGITAALAKATPSDEVAAACFPVERTLGIFTTEEATAFRLVLIGDEMQIEFYALEQPIEKDSSKIVERDYDIPTSLPSFAPKFKIVPGEAQRISGDRAVLIAWRDDYYRKPVNLSFRDGQARRRTVLMEMPDEVDPKAPAAPTSVPPGLADAQIRALDQLDAARQSGLVKEADYQRRRRLILEGKLDEAGYGAAPKK